MTTLSKEDLKKLMDDDLSDDQIADKFTRSSKWVAQLRGEYGLLRRNANFVSDEEIKKVKELAAQGLTRAEICEELNRADSTVRTICVRHNIKTRFTTHSPERVQALAEKIKSLVAQGYHTDKAIAAELKIHRETSKRTRKSFGIVFPPSIPSAETIRNMVNGGLTDKQIATNFGRTNERWAQRLRLKYGIYLEKKQAVAVRKEMAARHLHFKKRFLLIGSAANYSPVGEGSSFNLDEECRAWVERGNKINRYESYDVAEYIGIPVRPTYKRIRA